MVFTKLHRSIAALLTAVGLGVLTAPALAASETSSAEITLDSTAAIVNSDIVLQSELNQMQAEVERNFKERGAQIDAITARRAALEQLITRSIILQQGKQFGLSLTDTQINQALAQTALSSNASVEQILASYKAPNEAVARQRFADDLIINEVRNNQVRRRVHISDAEVNLLAKSLREIGSVEPSYHLAQIILPLDPRASYARVEAVTALANRVKREAQQGTDFMALSAQYAQGSTAAQGGDLGYVTESQVPVPFLPALLKAQVGDIIGPFRSPMGMHLIKLFDVTHQAVEPITTYKASHILLKTSIIFSDEAAQSELITLRTSILNGELSFADAAKKYSEDTGSASLGGELGYAPANTYVPGFARALVNLQEGEISQPVKSNYGWHLIYLEDKKIDKDSDEAYQQRARELIYNRIFAQEGAAWEREIRAAAYVRVTDPQLLDAGVERTINSDEAIEVER
ncbi:MAG: peptidylprolyl isomerase [Anaerobiospirillum sp.]|nr:peptidylprolyl isomerase [Anaerobiospirillum sp.]